MTKMNHKIITEETVSLSNGFQSGMWVKFLAQTPEGEWIEEKVVGTGEATWHDDVEVSGEIVSLKGKRGIVGSFYGDSPHHRQQTVTGFFGFTAEELDATSPKSGYSCADCGWNAHRWHNVGTLEEYLLALFVDRHFECWSDMVDGVHKMPYQWGAQAATSYALVISGKLVSEVTGCGEWAPFLVESREKCLADRRLYTSCDKEDEESEERDFSRVADKLGFSGKVLTDDERRVVGLELRREYADANAEVDDTGILRRLLDHYRQGLNPLRSLRREKGGTWSFHREYPMHLHGEDCSLPVNVKLFAGEDWYVSWVQ